MRVIPSVAKKWLVFFVVNATILGCSFQYLLGNKIDYWIHDMALVFQARTVWKYTGVVVLDSGVPIQVSRKQALPLYARATEHLIAAGVKGVYLDARLSKENEGAMPFAVCMEQNGDVRWSHPTCTIAESQCHIINSVAGNAPLRMKHDVFSHFKVAPYLENQADLPDFLLYDWENEAFIPKTGLVAADRLVTKSTPIARWIDMTENHVSVVMAKMIDLERTLDVIASGVNERCDQDLLCRRIRLSYPQYTTQFSLNQPIIPVSTLASCNQEIAMGAASLLKGRIVTLQLTTPTEATDAIISPMTTAMFGPYLLTPGAQYIADSIETILNDDAPREPSLLIQFVLFFVVAVMAVFSSAYLRQLNWLWCLGVLLLGLMATLCFFNPIVQFWPVTVTMLVFITGVLQAVGLHLLIGLKEGQLILQYMPKPVHSLLFNLSTKKKFTNQRRQVVVLMSDLKGYTTITGVLEDPVLILKLMNDYLEQTTLILQEKYQGWLETYIGDMVCYYWPYEAKNKEMVFKNALRGAVELSQLQKKFFSDILHHYKGALDDAKLHNIQFIIDAGIGLSAGEVVMGDLGPKQGVRKFGILGDPMNLTSRIEALTRYFSTQIIIPEIFLEVSQQFGLPTRRLGCFRVKGRNEPISIYALGTKDDSRFQADVVKAWENWLVVLEENSFDSRLSDREDLIDNLTVSCPQIFKKDCLALIKWHHQGLLKEGVWNLDEK